MNVPLFDPWWRIAPEDMPLWYRQHVRPRLLMLLCACLGHMLEHDDLRCLRCRGPA